MYEVYNLSKTDTVFLEYAANAAYLDKDFDKALEYFTALKRCWLYTGIVTEYTLLRMLLQVKEKIWVRKSQMDLDGKIKAICGAKSYYF